jgi:hypothetical protein
MKNQQRETRIPIYSGLGIEIGYLLRVPQGYIPYLASGESLVKCFSCRVSAEAYLESVCIRLSTRTQKRFGQYQQPPF